MKEALVCFVIALIVGSIMNGTRQLDIWGGVSTNGIQASATVPAVTESTFQNQVLESDQPVLVDFYADDCPHCVDMVPVIAHLATDLKGTAKIVRMDAGECASIAQKYGVADLPNYTLFKNGEKIDSITGQRTMDELVTFIRTAKSKPSDSAAAEQQDQTPHQPNNQS